MCFVFLPTSHQFVCVFLGGSKKERRSSQINKNIYTNKWWWYACINWWFQAYISQQKPSTFLKVSHHSTIFHLASHLRLQPLQWRRWDWSDWSKLWSEYGSGADTSSHVKPNDTGKNLDVYAETNDTKMQLNTSLQLATHISLHCFDMLWLQVIIKFCFNLFSLFFQVWPWFASRFFEARKKKIQIIMQLVPSRGSSASELGWNTCHTRQRGGW